MLGVLCATWPALAGAQEPTDSLLARLRRLEAAVTTLERQVAEQSGSAVATRSGAKLTVSGRIAVHTFANSRRVNNVDNPQLVLVDAAASGGNRGAGMSMRHTRLRLALSGATAFGAPSAADLEVDFHGGQLPSSGGRHFPLIRLRTARAIVFWDRAELLFGQETPLISDLNPESPVAIGTPGFAAAGNLWLWLPQVRFTGYVSAAKRVGVQGAILAPTSGETPGLFDTDNDIAERASRPYLQARVFARMGADDRPSEIGCGAHRGWLRPGADLTSSSAVACDLLLRMGAADLRGEYFTGQSLRGLGGGGIGQSFTPANSPLETSGGWAQLNFAPAGWMKAGAGCGADHPRADAPRRRNDACAIHLSTTSLAGPSAGAEFRRTRTEYGSGRYTNDHVTLALGWEF